MKLIRLYSQNPKGIFDNEFNEDIIIEPYSKIALQSFSAQIDTEEMTIDSQNDYMQFKIVDTSPDFKGFHIDHGTFNSSNYGTLFSDISLKMNRLMDNATNELGRQWRIGDNVSNKHVNFSLKLGTYVSPESTDAKVVPLVGKVNCVGTQAGIFNRNGGIETRNDAFLYIRSPNCKGASSFRARLYNNPASGIAQGFVLAYLASPPDRNITEIDPQDILYGIRMVGIGERYKYIRNGVEIAHSTLNAQVAGTNNKDNDYLSIDTSRGSISLNVYRGDTKHELFTDVYNHIKDLFPVLIFVGDSNFRVNAIKFTSDPFYNIVNVPVNETELGTIIPSGGAQTAIKTLQFADADLAKFFGFKKTEYKSPNPVYEYDFVSEASFQPSDFSDSYIIEMLNLNIDAYDGWNKQHKNILATITQADVIRERLTYSANFPIFLNLLTPTRLLLRRISARLLREDFSAVNLTGFSQITIIISQ